MRVRESLGSAATVSQRWSCWPVGGSKTYYGPETVSYVDGHNRISDDPVWTWVTYPDGRKCPKFKPVENEGFAIDLNRGNADVLVVDANPDVICNVFVLREFSHAMFPIPPGDLGAWFRTRLRAPIKGPWYDFGTRWEKCKPSMTTRANLSVFLAELRDIKKLFDVTPRGFESWKSGKALSKYLNGQHLNYNFGWKPFVSDLKHMFEALATFDARLKEFLQNEGLMLSKHKGTKEVVLDQTSIIACPYNSDWEVEEVLTGTETILSTFHFSYSVPALNGDELRLRAIADSLGLHLSPAVLWELIPYSFVIDWFVDIGRILEDAQTDWLEPDINVVQACSTSKASVQAQWFFKRRTLNKEKIPLGTGSLTLFQRFPGFPPITSDWRLGNLDADKIRLLASLGLNFLI